MALGADYPETAIVSVILLDAIDSKGCVQPPRGPGLGVEYDWGFITRHSKGVAVYD